MIKAIFFDLDYTLYDQTLYFSSSFAAIARYLRERYSLSEEEIIARLKILLDNKGSTHPKLFNDLLEYLGLCDEQLVKTLVRIFHEAPVESLVLYEDARSVLPHLAQRYMLGLITNGNPEMQRRKVTALGLEDLIPIHVYTAEIGCPKPGVGGYEYAIKAAKVKARESLYLGDNPYVDFIGAKQLGMYTVRLLRGEFMLVKDNSYMIDFEIRDFYQFENMFPNFDIREGP